MNKPYIEFKKQRDFGALLSDTFNFIRNEFKPFMKTIFTISGPALTVFLLTTALYTYSAGETMNMDIFEVLSYQFTNPIFYLYYLMLFVAIMFISTSSLHYIKSYIANSGNVNSEEIKRNVYKTLTGFLGLGFLKWATLTITLSLCILPALYFMVPMYIVLSIYVFNENSNVSDSYSKSYSLVNADFWVSLGIIIVVAILVYILNFIVALPAAIYTLIGTGIFSGEIDPGASVLQPDPIFIFLNILSNIFSVVLNVVPIICGVFLYFHLNEKVNFTGTYERISNIGNTED
ncbi:hypothetical protein ACFQ1Q_09705 [Winogradskyella litorisediminis]|uniref:Glycerophosphoryl diester phosphodiesterase membrane domain-containing protein n=1 Tax=Winogradskyella litorisediminis TaxID=1156618 RepID=A0ABW3N747_9FLAO